MIHEWVVDFLRCNIVDMKVDASKAMVYGSMLLELEDNVSFFGAS